MSATAEDVSTIDREAHGRGYVLIVEDDIRAITDLEAQLESFGHRVLVSSSGKHAVELIEKNNVDLVFVKTHLIDMPGCKLIGHIRENSTECYKPVVLLVSEPDDEALLDCMAAGGDDFIIYGFTPVIIKACISAMEQLRELRHLYKGSIHEQVVGKQILSAALSARNIDVDGMRILSRSAAIFSGDLVLSARNPGGGLHILLADFTGHGLSAAIGVLPVADMFSVMTEKGFEPEKILKNINKKLHTLLPTGMFMAACMLEIDSNMRNASVWNSGMPDVYLLDRESGNIKRRIKSTHIPLGINAGIDNRLEYEVLDILPGDQFIMHTDGLTDVIDSSGIMFGVSRLEHLMGEAGSADSVFHAIESAFNQFCAGKELSDDVTLVSIPCGANLLQSFSSEAAVNYQVNRNSKDGWRFMMELNGPNLRKVDPVQIVVDQYRNMGDFVVSIESLKDILSALYENALNHGVLELSHIYNSSEKNDDTYREERNKRIERLDYGFVRIELQQIKYQGNNSLLIRVEDSGRGFDHVGLMSGIYNGSKRMPGTNGSGIPMVRELCQSLHYQGRGNKVEVIVDSRKHCSINHE